MRLVGGEKKKLAVPHPINSTRTPLRPTLTHHTNDGLVRHAFALSKTITMLSLILVAAPANDTMVPQVYSTCKELICEESHANKICLRSRLQDSQQQSLLLVQGFARRQEEMSPGRRVC